MKTLWISAAVGVVLGLGVSAGAQAYAAPQQQAKSTPKGWNWTLDKNGRRVQKGKVVTTSDGSRREEIRAGKCVTIRETTKAGEFKQTSKCGGN